MVWHFGFVAFWLYGAMAILPKRHKTKTPINYLKIVTQFLTGSGSSAVALYIFWFCGARPYCQNTIKPKHLSTI